MAVEAKDSDRAVGFDWSPPANEATAVTTLGALPVLRVRHWQDPPRLRHGFLGRRGGASTGPFQSLNLSGLVDDDPTALRANQAAVQGALSDMKVVRMRQVHGDHVVCVSNAEQEVGEADGTMTRQAGLALCVLTADCVPILLVAGSRGIVAAVHAGWRGTLAGIAALALRRAQHEWGVRPDEWEAAMGPSIGGCCYEVDIEIVEQLESRWGEMPEAWSRAGRKAQLDLRQVNRSILVGAGVRPDLIFAIGPCTACAHTDFFSHRKSGGRTGRQLSYVGWAPN